MAAGYTPVPDPPSQAGTIPSASEVHVGALPAMGEAEQDGNPGAWSSDATPSWGQVSGWFNPYHA